MREPVTLSALLWLSQRVSTNELLLLSVSSPPLLACVFMTAGLGNGMGDIGESIGDGGWTPPESRT